MASDSAIDAALAELHAQDSPSRSNNKSKGNNHNHNNKGNYNYGTLNPSDNTNNGGGASGGNRSRSVSVSTRASGFSADELVRPALNYASESGQSHSAPGFTSHYTATDFEFTMAHTLFDWIRFVFMCVWIHRPTPSHPTSRKNKAQPIEMEEGVSCASLSEKCRPPSDMFEYR